MILLLLYLFNAMAINLCQDYWSEDFDENKNCEDEELIGKLMIEKNPEKCAMKWKGGESIQWEECKKDLSTKLVKKCGILNIEKTGELLYCKVRGKTLCCFHQESCSETYEVVHDRMTRQSTKFLDNPEEFVKDMVTNLHYDTCHAITDYDATKCAEDCKQLEKEKFAKECTDNGGLFKCCIRRDKEFCHECRFCCTLSVCTTQEGTVYKGSENITQNENEDQKVNSVMGFETDQKMWKAYDYRCLKPKSDLKPEDWPHFEMNAYRYAKTKEELENVQEINFDKNFFNLEDPNVFKEMIKGTQREKIWKKTYGFDYVSFNDKKNSPHVSFECFKNCYEAEKKGFARECKNKGGLFKCCMVIFVMERFEDVRNVLKQKKQIPGGQTKICKPHGRFTQCALCTITQICAYTNPLTGDVTETFKTPYNNLQHKIGGRATGHGLKYWICQVQDTCQSDQGKQMGLYVPHEDFTRASTQDEFCNLTQFYNGTIQQRGERREPFQTHYYNECRKQDSPNVFLCPNNEHLRTQDNNTEYIKDNLIRLKKDMKIKKRKRKNNSSHSKKRGKAKKYTKKKKGSKKSKKTSKKHKQRKRRKCKQNKISKNKCKRKRRNKDKDKI